MKELTKAEEQVMQVLWKIGTGYVNDVLDRFPEPKPAYNTISTIIRILERKGFVDHRAFGKTHEYFPLVSKKDYSKAYLGQVMKGYFSGSFMQLVSFFARESDLSVKDLEEIRKMMDEEIKQKKHYGHD
jgi:BlaI family transcriptional regulator, penicillinase repressor